MAFSDQPSRVVVAPSGAVSDDTTYVDWPAIFAGAVLALAIAFVLLTFGSALGLSIASPYEGEGVGAVGFAIAAGLWLLWVQSSSCFAGGYLTGRLRRRKHDATEDESDIRDGSHGLVVWGLGVLIGALLAISGITGAISTAVGAAGSAAGTVASVGAAAGAGALAGGAASGSEGGTGGYDLLVDRFLRGNAPPPAPAAGGAPAPAAPDAAATGDLRAELGRILADTVSTGQINDADRQYLTQTIAARTGVDQAAAEARVNELVQGVQSAEQQARDAAEAARRTALIAAFATAASFLISAAAAYAGATLGGKHRDENTIIEGWIRRR